MSSSGSGVATAAGLCYAAIGTGGSIRNPASTNGVVGLKPTYGRVSRFGVLAMADSLDHVGPIARCVADVAIMFDAIAGRDPKDPTSLEAPASHAFKDLMEDIRGLRIGVDRDYALKGIDSGQAVAIERAVQVLSGLGATVVEVRMPDLSGLIEMWSAICGSEIVAAHCGELFVGGQLIYGVQQRAMRHVYAAKTPSGGNLGDFRANECR
jgi:amidase